MSALLATVVDVEALAKTAAASLIAGIGVPFLFATAIFGVARSLDLQRDGRSVAAAGAIALAAVALLASIAAVVIGILVMIAD